MKATPSGIRAHELKRELRAVDVKIGEAKRRRWRYSDVDRAKLRSQKEELEAQIYELEKKIPFEALSIRKNPYTRTTKKGEKRVYYRWVASWRERGKTRVVYLGSVDKITEEEALRRAIEMKRMALEVTAADVEMIKTLWNSGEEDVSKIADHIKKPWKAVYKEIQDMRYRRKEIGPSAWEIKARAEAARLGL